METKIHPRAIEILGVTRVNRALAFAAEPAQPPRGDDQQRCLECGEMMTFENCPTSGCAAGVIECGDCNAPVFYDDARGTWYHVEEIPACFLSGSPS